MTEGFTSVEEVAYVPLEDLTGIEGFDENVAQELRNRARIWIEEQTAKTLATLREQGMQDELLNFDGLKPEMLEALGKHKILTLDDFAELSREDFTDILPDTGLSHEEIDALIMKARAHWFADEEQAKA